MGHLEESDCSFITNNSFSEFKTNPAQPTYKRKHTNTNTHQLKNKQSIKKKCEKVSQTRGGGRQVTWWVAKGGTLSGSSGCNHTFITQSPFAEIWWNSKPHSAARGMRWPIASGTRSQALFNPFFGELFRVYSLSLCVCVCVCVCVCHLCLPLSNGRAQTSLCCDPCM